MDTNKGQGAAKGQPEMALLRALSPAPATGADNVTAAAANVTAGVDGGVAPGVDSDAVTPIDAAASFGILDAAGVARWVAALALMGQGVGDAERIRQLRALEDLKAAAAAAQARVAVDFSASQRLAKAAAGLPAKDLGKGIGTQSPWPGASPRSAGAA